MASPKTQDPVSAALLELYNSYADRRQAELDLERASAAERFTGRTAIPGVFAQLQANADKERARREKIAKQGEQQAPTPASLTPPMTDVDGQTSGRSAAPMMAAAGELIANMVSGGKGVKTGQMGAGGGLPGSTGGINPGATVGGGQRPQPAGTPLMAAGISGPVLQGAAAIPQVLAGQQPTVQQAGTTTGPTGPPGSMQPVEQKLSDVERYLIGPMAALGGVATKNVPLAIQGVSDLVKGKRTVDYQQVPTVPEQAAPLAKPLSVYAAGSLSPEPGRADLYQRALDQRVEQIRKEFGNDVAESAYTQAMDIAAAEEYKRYLAEETPKAKLERFHSTTILGIEEHLADGGTLEDLPKGLQQLYAKSGRSTTVNVDNRDMGKLTTATQSAVQQGRIATLPSLQLINELETSFYEPAYTVQGQSRYLYLKGQDAIGAINEQEAEELGRFNDNQKALDGLTVENLRATAGKAMTETEIRWIVKTLVPQIGGTSAKQAIAFVREQLGLANFRYATLLGETTDPKSAMELGDVRALAVSSAQRRMDELKAAGGFTPEQAKAQIASEFRAEYGLDLNRLLDRVTPVSQ